MLPAGGVKEKPAGAPPLQVNPLLALHSSPCGSRYSGPPALTRIEVKGASVTDALPVLALLAWLVAVIVTCCWAGIIEGAM